ncbi:MAG: cytochrome c nitrite reductase small subunit [Propionibacteriaceae bacterium]|jgi:cytochrome c nitrite reductase small subunit|nr:cytochrome c nitrite reductase small subunit [Propionibacteriaceae bacterium]
MTETSQPRQSRRRFPVLKLLVAVLIGTALGSGVFAVNYSEATSYLGTAPETCANCHVMQDHYDAWAAGSHANVATCNDCHLPHDSVVAKYYVKLDDGIRHTTAFTFGNYPDNIVIRDSSREVVDSACVYCHGAMTDTLMYTVKDGESISCVRCHSDVGHSI